VAHACNPSYSGGRDQEDHSSKQALANSSQDRISKKKKQKKNNHYGEVAQGVGPQVQTPVPKKKKKTTVACACHPNYLGG
jgi:SET domain-containing protein